jgi:selT/selW/selH-like putative selenoprotein
MPVPHWYRQVAQNRIGYLMLAFFVGNMISNSLKQTGAFEVYYDGRLIWSKLQSGRVPDLGSILRALVQAIGR